MDKTLEQRARDFVDTGLDPHAPRDWQCAVGVALFLILDELRAIRAQLTKEPT